jgi:hypothetical protein
MDYEDPYQIWVLVVDPDPMSYPYVLYNMHRKIKLQINSASDLEQQLLLYGIHPDNAIDPMRRNILEIYRKIKDDINIIDNLFPDIEETMKLDNNNTVARKRNIAGRYNIYHPTSLSLVTGADHEKTR